MYNDKVKASVLLAEKIEDRSIINLLDKLKYGIDREWWMYLTVKTNLEENTEIKIGFDVLKVDEEDGDFGIELGEMVIGATNDDEKIKEIEDGSYKPLRVRNKAHGISMYGHVFNIGQKFPPLSMLERGNYEFIVYLKDGEDNIILDTYQFIVE